jgi:hypothetical protein
MFCALPLVMENGFRDFLNRLNGGFETGILHGIYNVLDCPALTEDDNGTAR